MSMGYKGKEDMKNYKKPRGDSSLEHTGYMNVLFRLSDK